MDTALQAILSWQFILFCIALASITFVIRKIVDYILDNASVPASKNSKLWRDLILPIMPVILGCLCGLIAKKYPFPDGVSSISGRMAFGLASGFLSGTVYRIMNSFLYAKISAIKSAMTQTVSTQDSTDITDK